MTRIVVGLSPLWLGALFLAFENTSGRAEKPLSTGVASAGTVELAKAPARRPSTSHAALAEETPPAPGRTPDPIVEPSSEDASPQPDQSNADAAKDGRLVQQTPEKLGTLPQIAWDEPVAEPLTATVLQPTWMPQPKPRHLARPSPEPEAPAPNLTAVSGSPEPRNQGDRWKYPPNSAADSGEPGQETPSGTTAAADSLAAPLSGARVVIHDPRSGASTGARDLLSVLRTQGVGVAEIRTVGASVSQPDIRFFHERDRAVAEQVVRMLSRQGYQPKVKDFTHYQQPPSRGTVEVWLPG